MPILPDDPRLTAYALGELDEIERTQFESELLDSPEGQRAVVEIRQTADLLRRELAAEAVPSDVVGTNAEATIAQSLDVSRPVVDDVPTSQVIHADWAGSPRAARLSALDSPRSRRMAFALAACLLVAVGGVLALSTSPRGRELASAYWETDDVQFASSKAAVSTNNPTPKATENGVIRTHGLIEDLYEKSAADPFEVNSFTQTQIEHARGEEQAAPASTTPTKDVTYTVGKPVREARTKVVEYTVNGQKVRREVPVTVTKSESIARAPGARRIGAIRSKLARDSRVGLNSQSVFSADLDIPFRQDSLAIQQPQYGGLDPKLSTSLQTMVTPRIIIQEEEEFNLTGQPIAARKKELAEARAKLEGEIADEVSKGKSPTAENEKLRKLSLAKLELELAEIEKSESDHNTEAYARIVENALLGVAENPLSTFSIDVDTASYANMRRFLNQGSLPPPDVVRIEELLNYFSYDYAPPTDDKPFAVHYEVAACPWDGNHRLVRIGIKGKVIENDKRPASNLVFLIDVSGSMDDPAKLPLLKSGLRLLVDKLGENDRVAIVVYAGSSGLVLESTGGDHKESIVASIEQLQAGGSTNGGSGIELAYQQAVKHFIKGGTNRVILCTDGDFNVGVTNDGDLTRLIEDKAKSDVFLSVLGFGEGNLKDATMEKLADKGNGNYSYVDTINEARKVLVEQMSGTLVTIAKDVKIQIEFNPAQVAGYRLIGYENRMLAKEDFNDDKKDAGEIGAGHTVTALYEIVPAGKPVEAPKVDELKYQKSNRLSDAAASGDLLTLKLRYKAPEGTQSTALEYPLKDSGADFGKASADFKFASAVASFGMLLRHSNYKGTSTFDGVLEIAESSKGEDKAGYRTEFIELVKKAKQVGGK